MMTTNAVIEEATPADAMSAATAALCLKKKGGHTMAQIIEARGVSRTFHTDGVAVEALRGADISVEEGEFVAVMGPSGCGKSTLLHILGGLDRPTSGEVRRASSEPYERALERANGPHAWFFGGRSDLAKIAQREGVVGFAGPYPVSLNFSVTVGRERHPVRFWATGAELPEVAPALLIEGRWLDPDGQDEVIIGAGFARDAGFEVGDEIVVADEAGRTALDIVGIAANLERAPYPDWELAVFHVLPGTFERLIDGRVNAFMLGVRLEDASASEQFIGQVRGDYPNVITRSWQEVRDSVNNNNMGNVVFLGVFSGFALLAVGFTACGLMLRMRSIRSFVRSVSVGVSRVPLGPILYHSYRPLRLGANPRVLLRGLRAALMKPSDGPDGAITRTVAHLPSSESENLPLSARGSK